MKTIFQIDLLETSIPDTIKDNVNTKLINIISTLRFNEDYEKTGYMMASDEGVVNTNNFLKRYNLLDLENFIIEKTYEYCDKLNIEVSEPLITFMSWCTKTPPGGHSSRHAHHPSTLVAVYYFNCTDNHGNLRLYNPLPHYYQKNNFFDIELADGKLVIFPGWIEHEIQKNCSDSARYSIAVNIQVYGNYEG